MKTILLVIISLPLIMPCGESQESESEKTKPERTLRRNIFNDEIVSSEDFDYGSKAHITMSHGNFQNIKGFVCIPILNSTYIQPKKETYDFLKGLVAGIQAFTPLKARLDKQINLSSSKLFKYPFVYIAADKFRLNEIEIRNLKEYFKMGGFVVWDMQHLFYEQLLREYFKDTVKFKPVSEDHLIYKSFFIIKKGSQYSAQSESYDTNTHITQKHLGLWIGNNLVGLYRDGIGKFWRENKRHDVELKKGVNMVVYTLIQGGDIVKRD